jgi:hypothetical protein
VSLPIGKLTIAVAPSSRSFTGKLLISSATIAMPISGALIIDVLTEEATGTATAVSNGVIYGVTFTLTMDGEVNASVTSNGAPFGTANDGRKLLTVPSAQRVAYSGAYTSVLEPAMTANSAVPGGAGWAKGTISTKGLLTLTGVLGDGTGFTAALQPDIERDPGYRLFIQPYKPARAGSFIGGKMTLIPHPSLVDRRYLEQASLTWRKLGLQTDASYRAVFGPVSTTIMMDPWRKPTGADTLAVRLGLPSNTFVVDHSATGSPAEVDLPTLVALSSKNVLSVMSPVTAPPNITKWKTLINASLGTFTGSFELFDGTQRRMVPFSGVLRQPASFTDNLIGDGHFLLPALNTAPSNEKVSGEVMFLR